MNVPSSRRCVATARRASLRARVLPSRAAEKLRKNVAQVAEISVAEIEIRALESARRTSAAREVLRAGVPELVVARALFRVFQRIVSLI